MESVGDDVDIGGVGGFGVAIPILFGMAVLPIGRVSLVEGVAKARSRRLILADTSRGKPLF